MEIMPILSALRRNKVGAVLVALQIALTLAVVANALSVIQRHWTDINRPSGLDEANIFSLSNQWVGQMEDLQPRIEADLTALRSLPGVIDAEATNSFPLSGNSWVYGVSLQPHQLHATTQTTVYYDTTHGLASQGLRVIAGRWFAPDEVVTTRMGADVAPPVAVITSALAKRLFPRASALGKTVYLTNDKPTQIVGVVERASAASGERLEGVDDSTFVSFRLVNNYLLYVVRTQPGQQAAAMAAAKTRLLDLSRMRVLGAAQTFAETRKNGFAVAAATSWLLAIVCGLLLAITACGTVGLTMCWVAQRRRQIGMRRALGARRVDILRYFHTENLLIAGTGALVGIAAGLGANIWLASHLAITRMNPAFIILGAVIVLCLSQLAVLWPAIRAAAVPPSLSARGL